jgi:uncharacterized protein (DUF4415 family)
LFWEVKQSIGGVSLWEKMHLTAPRRGLHLRRESVRLISARMATTRETTQYEDIMKREYGFRKAKHGAVVSVPKGKTRITIRLDDEILAWFREEVERAGGGNYPSSTKSCANTSRAPRNHWKRHSAALFVKRSAGRPSLHLAPAAHHNCPY